jgi:hypothetical protein
MKEVLVTVSQLPTELSEIILSYYYPDIKVGDHFLCQPSGQYNFHRTQNVPYVLIEIKRLDFISDVYLNATKNSVFQGGFEDVFLSSKEGQEKGKLGLSFHYKGFHRGSSTTKDLYEYLPLECISKRFFQLPILLNKNSFQCQDLVLFYNCFRNSINYARVVTVAHGMLELVVKTNYTQPDTFEWVRESSKKLFLLPESEKRRGPDMGTIYHIYGVADNVFLQTPFTDLFQDVLVDLCTCKICKKS